MVFFFCSSGVSARVIKNWEVLESGVPLLAIPTCDSAMSKI